MKKFYRVINVLLLVVFISFLGACGGSSSTKISSVSIYKDAVEIEELNVIVGDKFSFSVKSDVNVITEMVWESSNTSVVNIDQNGNATSNNTFITR